MAKIDKARKAEAYDAIRHHLKTYGPEKWPLVMDKFPEVNQRTFFRWIGAVRAELADQKEVANARKKIERRLAADAERTADEIASETDKQIRMAPSPDYVARSGADGQKNLDLLEKFHQVFTDAELLRQHGMTPDGQKIKNPKYFAQSIGLRRNLIETALKVTQEVWDLRRMQAFYDTVLEEIAAESPEVAERILMRLSKLNADVGMTYTEARV